MEIETAHSSRKDKHLEIDMTIIEVMIIEVIVIIQKNQQSLKPLEVVILLRFILLKRINI